MSSIFGPVVAPYFSLQLSQAHDTHSELFSLVRHKDGGCKLQDVLRDGVGRFPKGVPQVIQNLTLLVLKQIVSWVHPI